MQPYVPVYRKLLVRAAKATWHHRALWVFGFFAGIAQTGAVTNEVLKLAPTLAPGTVSWQTLEETWNAFAFGKTFVATLMTGTGDQVAATLAFSIGLLVCAVFLMMVAQHVVFTHIHRAAAKKKPRPFKAVTEEIRATHVARLFALNVIGRLALAIVLLLGALGLRSLLGAVADNVEVFAALGVYLVVLPAAFTVNAVAITALIHAVRKDEGVIPSLQHATTFLSRHWLSAVEFSAILFLINYIVTAIILAVLLLGGVLTYAVLAAVAASLPLLVLASVVTGVLILFLIVALGGMMTTFNYAAWTEFLERYERLPAHPRAEHAARRVVRAFSR
ncbi:hypothetical protein HYS28_03670 [Candidatus Uhrbacteria bacterium]|nr:hypothetical protein [Candidatus Uhrbacteria bacterium]